MGLLYYVTILKKEKDKVSLGPSLMHVYLIHLSCFLSNSTQPACRSLIVAFLSTYYYLRSRRPNFA